MTTSKVRRFAPTALVAIGVVGHVTGRDPLIREASEAKLQPRGVP
jgi:hypothetical protein